MEVSLSVLHQMSKGNEERRNSHIDEFVMPVFGRYFHCQFIVADSSLIPALIGLEYKLIK